ncbi:hypothetical protein CF319_g8821 [Tilletia indica]|nr:hypothetical protein CF319_g8821 [Tilletia indica]
MPRLSVRTRIERDVTTATLIHVDALLEHAAEADEQSDGDSSADEAMEEALLTLHSLQTIQHQRYLSERAPLARIKVTLLQRLEAYEKNSDIACFRQLVRMEPASFHEIVNILAKHPLFLNTRGSPTPVADQVAVGLFRLGHDGNGASVKNTAELCGFSEGSVVNFTRRTIRALCSLEKDVLCWASESEKQQSKIWVEERCGIAEWRNGFASVDGVHMNCAWGPGLDHGDAFMNRKRRFSFNVQLVTMVHTLRIISYVVGHRGASSDARAWACSSVVDAPARYLGPEEWI